MHSPVTISVGLPVYNGEKYLAEAIESILSQSFDDLELIVSDNASTDRTAEICASYAARDERIRYYRNESNIGAAENFNRAFHLAKGRFFKWASHDDRCACDYLEKCIHVLTSDPTIVLCHSMIHIIDTNGDFVSSFDPALPETESLSPSTRFRGLTRLDHYCYDVFGVIRSDVLRKTSLIASYIGSDHSLLVELGLRGRMHRIPEPLFFARDHEERSIRSLDVRDRGEWFHPALKGSVAFPFFRRLVEFTRCIHRVQMVSREKRRCYAFMPVWIKNNRSRLLEDALHTGAYLRSRVRRRWTRGETKVYPPVSSR